MLLFLLGKMKTGAGWGRGQTEHSCVAPASAAVCVAMGSLPGATTRRMRALFVLPGNAWEATRIRGARSKGRAKAERECGASMRQVHTRGWGSRRVWRAYTMTQG
ncbi:hypothetical protein MRX96_014928 [Rhipicephalus microplus]